MRFKHGLILATMLVASSALADTISDSAAKVTIDVPANWKSSANGNQITLADKHDDIGITFVAVEAGSVKKATKRVAREMGNRIDKLTFTSEQRISLNGMDGVQFKGDGLLNGVNIDLGVVVLDTPSDTNDLLIIALGEDAKGNATLPVELRVVTAARWDSYATLFSGATVAVAG